MGTSRFLAALDITVEHERASYSYRGKGGELARRELAQPAFDALIVTLADAEKTLPTSELTESLWQAGAGEREV